jgi:hypothetical protein
LGNRMQLYGFSDHESQLLPLSPNLYTWTMVSPGDLETQPLWLRVVIPEAIPDACRTLVIGPDASAYLEVPADADPTLLIRPDADAELHDDALAEILLRIAADAEVTMDLQLEDAGVMLSLKPDADAALEIASDCSILLSMGADASATLADEGPTEMELDIGADAHTFLDVEACEE